MLTVFNRRELLTTFDMKELSKIRDLLAANGIDYSVKTVNPSAGAFVGGSRRGQTGSAFLNTDAMYQYYIYVHTKDYDRASVLL